MKYYMITAEQLDNTEYRPLGVEWLEIDWPSEVKSIDWVSDTSDDLTVWKVTNTDGSYYGIVAQRYWYAVMRDRDDDDWGTGSYDLDEAKQMARNYGDEAYIAVIEESENPVCVEEIEQEDF